MNRKSYVGLCSAERSEIQILKDKGYSIRKIAVALGRSPNTISREIKVNGVAGEYIAVKAKQRVGCPDEVVGTNGKRLNKITGLDCSS